MHNVMFTAETNAIKGVTWIHQTYFITTQITNRQQCYKVSPQWDEKRIGSKGLNSRVDSLLWQWCFVCYRRLWGQMLVSTWLFCNDSEKLLNCVNLYSSWCLRVFAIMSKKKSRYIAIESKYIVNVSVSDQMCKVTDGTLLPWFGTLAGQRYSMKTIRII